MENNLESIEAFTKNVAKSFDRMNSKSVNVVKVVKEYADFFLRPKEKEQLQSRIQKIQQSKDLLIRIMDEILTIMPEFACYLSLVEKALKSAVVPTLQEVRMNILEILEFIAIYSSQSVEKSQSILSVLEEYTKHKNNEGIHCREHGHDQEFKEKRQKEEKKSESQEPKRKEKENGEEQKGKRLKSRKERKNGKSKSAQKEKKPEIKKEENEKPERSAQEEEKIGSEANAVKTSGTEASAVKTSGIETNAVKNSGIEVNPAKKSGLNDGQDSRMKKEEGEEVPIQPDKPENDLKEGFIQVKEEKKDAGTTKSNMVQTQAPPCAVAPHFEGEQKRSETPEKKEEREASLASKQSQSGRKGRESRKKRGNKRKPRNESKEEPNELPPLKMGPELNSSEAENRKERDDAEDANASANESPSQSFLQDKEFEETIEEFRTRLRDHKINDKKHHPMFSGEFLEKIGRFFGSCQQS